VAAGDYPLELAKKGFRPLKTTLAVPSSGDQTSPFSLEPDSAEAPVVVDEVAVRLTSEPPGATVTLDGVKQGVTPLTVKRPGGSTSSLIVELAGHQGQSMQLEVPAGQASFERAFLLKPDVADRPAPTVKPVPRPPVAVTPTPTPTPRAPEVRATGNGTVRFVATPYATVECPPYKFGDTPFGDKQMAAGEYRCTFTNAELGKSQTKVIRVEANDVLKVKVSFE
jgi:hypothetical protein